MAVCVVCVLPLNSWGPQIRSVCGGSQKPYIRTHTTGIYSFLNWSQHGSVCPFHVCCMQEKEIYILRPNYFTVCRCKSLLNQNTCLFVFVKIIFIEWKEMLNLKRKFILFSYWPLLYTFSIMKVKGNCGCKLNYYIHTRYSKPWSLDIQEPKSLGTSGIKWHHRTIYVGLTVWLL